MSLGFKSLMEIAVIGCNRLRQFLKIKAPSYFWVSKIIPLT